MRLSALLVMSLAIVACRGQVSEEPPIHIIPDMDWQPKYLQQGESDWEGFADHRASRTPPEGTVAHGSLKEDSAYFQGKVDGSFVNRIPFEVSSETFRRGNQRFNIYCAPCHDQTGGGNGAVAQHGVPVGLPKPAILTSDHTRAMSDGEIFDTISHGTPNKNMPSYGSQVPEADRWAIVSWVRVLQRAAHSTLGDVPGADRGNIAKEEPAQ